MFICICHALTDSDVNEASAKGARREEDVFSQFGVEPRCRRCVPCIRGLLSRSDELVALHPIEDGPEDKHKNLIPQP